MINLFSHKQPKQQQIVQSITDIVTGEHVHLMSDDNILYPAIVHRAYNRVNLYTHDTGPRVMVSVWYGDRWTTIIVPLKIVVKRDWQFAEK